MIGNVECQKWVVFMYQKIHHLNFIHLNEMIELEKKFGDRLEIRLKSLDKLNLIVFDFGGSKIFKGIRSKFKFTLTNVHEPFNGSKPMSAALKEFVDYDDTYGERLGVDKTTYNELILQCVSDLEQQLELILEPLCKKCKKEDGPVCQQ